MDTTNFWIKYTDDQILYALQRYLYLNYGFSKTEIKEIANPFYRHVYYASHVLSYLVDNGWEVFKKSVWNRPDFFEGLGYFNFRFTQEIKSRISTYDPNDKDWIRDYIIENNIVLQFKMSEAIRLHRIKFDPILNELTTLIEEIIIEDDTIFIEQWKKDLL